jgi:hypothetical protein
VADHPGAPGGPPLEELGTREREEHDPMVPDVRDEVVDQVEQSVVGPVQVLEHEQQRFAFGHLLDQPAHREQEMHRLVRRFVQPETEQQRQVPRLLGDVGLEEQRTRERRELAPRVRHRFGLEDAGGGAHHLGGGAERALLLVRQAPAPELAAALGPDVLGDLVGEPRLPDPGGTEHRHEVRMIRGDGPVPDGSDQGKLVVRPTSGVSEVGRPAGVPSASPTSHASTGSRLPFASIGGMTSNANA